MTFRSRFCLLLGVALVLATRSGKVVAQEIRFSQYQAAPLLLNPAAAGSVADPTLGTVYRLQQLGILTYRTGYFSAMLPLYSGPRTSGSLPGGGLGVGFMSDLAGENSEWQTYRVDVSGAYTLGLNRLQTQFVSVGLQASYVSTRIDFSALTWPSQITYRGFEGPAPPSGTYASQASALRLNSGFLWVYDPLRNPLRKLATYRLHLGASVSNLNRPVFEFSSDGAELPWVYKVHGGGQFRASERLDVSPGFFVIAQEALAQYTGGATLGLRVLANRPNVPTDLRLLLGGWYRYDDAFVLLLGAQTSQFDAALSYDTNATSRRTGIVSQGALELSVGYRFLSKSTSVLPPSPLF
jgi:type IX secretion system PorP/SprF family membrane protein